MNIFFSRQLPSMILVCILFFQVQSFNNNLEFFALLQCQRHYHSHTSNLYIERFNLRLNLSKLLVSDFLTFFSTIHKMDFWFLFDKSYYLNGFPCSPSVIYALSEYAFRPSTIKLLPTNLNAFHYFIQHKQRTFD